MPTYSYPGVYIEEVPSGVRTISGVSSSDTAFVGFFKRGPMKKPVRITSFSDFERRFGGLDDRSEASYAIEQYYQNGGQIAWVVRVASGNPKFADVKLEGPLKPKPSLTIQAASEGELEEPPKPKPSLTIQAASQGKWGNRIRVAVKHVGKDKFNITVEEMSAPNCDKKGVECFAISSETYYNLSMNINSAKYVVDVINNQSSLIQIPKDNTLRSRPSETEKKQLTGGNDGQPPDAEALKEGMNTLDTIAPYVFNILCLPRAFKLNKTQWEAIYKEAHGLCINKRAFLIIDLPKSIASKKSNKSATDIVAWMNGVPREIREKNAAVYFPCLQMPDQLKEYRLREVGPSGTLAGIYARTDNARGIWKAPAGTEATLRGATPVRKLTDSESGVLNQSGINALRILPIYDNVSWGARTLKGADQMASEWKYIPVRRLALYIEESLYQALQWVVFEPNDEPLWSQIRLNVGAFMQDLFRQGAFQGSTPNEAYFVRCDQNTTTQHDIDRGIVNVLVGFAPLKPAEFVVVKLQQMAGQGLT